MTTSHRKNRARWLSIAAGLGLSAALAAPLLGEHGFDLNAMDKTTRPGDDFFGYATGAWLERTPIPADQSGITRRVQMSDRTEARLHELMQQAARRTAHRPGDLESKVGAFYKAFMDQPRIERQGIGPIAAELQSIRHQQSAADAAARMGRSPYGLESSFFSLSTEVDLKDPSHYLVRLSQDGLGLPDRDYYLEASFAPQRRAYRAYIAHLLGLLHWAHAAARADDVLLLEIRIAGESWSRTRSRELEATYNPVTPADLARQAPGFDWAGFLAAAQLADLERLIVSQPSAVTALAALFARTPQSTLEAWQAFHVADNAAPYLPQSFADAWFDFHGRLLAGQQAPGPRWRRAVTAVSGDSFGSDDRFGSFGTMGWAVGQLYTARYFPPAAKAQVEGLVAHLIESYHRRLEQLDWMSPETRAEAIRKLDTYRVKVGYPEHPRDYSDLRITDDDLLGDVRSVAAADWSYEVRRLHRPTDISEWDMTPQTNNAYNGSLRDIVFPAGILQPPIFDPDADPAYNYGAVGGVIGHELTHGFDDQGRKIDASGQLRDWWLPADAATFEQRARQLSAQYSAFRPIAGDDDTHITGDLTLGENIADLGGVTLALDAYHASLGGQTAPVVDGLTGDQRVLLGWAQAWAGKYNDDFVRKQVVSDPHSPRRFRVNGVVRNIDAWYQAFGVAAGERLYLAPDQRVHIW